MRLTNVFGQFYFIKRLIIFIIGIYTYRRYNGFNKLEIKGTENLKNLPKQNVLFISNHQTYYADVIAFLHVFYSFKNGFINTIKNPIYLLNPMLDIYYVAAEETMKAGILAKIFSYAGAVTVKRTWRVSGENVQRKVDLNEVSNINLALKNGWVVTFPKGTTKAFAAGRKGATHLIKENKPIVVPILIDGFRRAFDKKGMFVKKKGVKLKMTIKPPLKIDYENDTNENILNYIMDEIEQSQNFLKVKPLDEDVVKPEV